MKYKYIGLEKIRILGKVVENGDIIESKKEINIKDFVKINSKKYEDEE